VHTLADEVRIFEDGALIAAHPVLEGRHQRRVAAEHRKAQRIADPGRNKPILILRKHVRSKASVNSPIPGAAAAPPRSATQKWSPRSPSDRLITENPPG